MLLHERIGLQGLYAENVVAKILQVAQRPTIGEVSRCSHAHHKAHPELMLDSWSTGYRTSSRAQTWPLPIQGQVLDLWFLSW